MSKREREKQRIERLANEMIELHQKWCCLQTKQIIGNDKQITIEE
jgi:hypothetical protein